jgi:hypothetical protein
MSDVLRLQIKTKAFFYCLGLALAFFSRANCEFYFEAYSGALFGSVHLNQIKTKNTYDNKGLNGYFKYFTSKEIETNFIGGVKLGSWFCKYAALESSVGKYFGCYLDASYDSFSFHKHLPTTGVSYTENSAGKATGVADTRFSLKGFDVTTSLLFAARLGVWPGKKNSFGVIQPYFAIGPALLIARQKPELKVDEHQADGSSLAVVVFNDKKISAERKTVLAPAMALDAGLRWIVTKNVFLDTFFKYRYARPHFVHKEMDFHPSYHLFSCALGLGYCF